MSVPGSLDDLSTPYTHLTRRPLNRRASSSSEELYVGTRVSIVPEPEAYAIQVSKPDTSSEIDLDLSVAQQPGIGQQLTGDKPSISDKARKRLSIKNKQKLRGDPEGEFIASIVVPVHTVCYSEEGTTASTQWQTQSEQVWEPSSQESY